MGSPRLRLLATLAGFAGLWPLVTFGQLEVQPQDEPQGIFGGDSRLVSVTFHNPSAKDLETEIHVRLFQASSATAVLVEDLPWKKLRVLGGQRVIESARLPILAVKGETRFVAQWVEASGRIIGKTDLLAYPSDLLGALKPVLADDPIGLWDPEDELKTFLKSKGLNCVDMEDSGLETFHGRLAIISPSRSKSLDSDFRAKVKGLARSGVAVVWLQPALPPNQLTPSFYAVQEGTGRLVMAQHGLTANLSQTPQSQLNLLGLVRFALQPGAGPPSVALSEQ